MEKRFGFIALSIVALLLTGCKNKGDDSSSSDSSSDTSASTSDTQSTTESEDIKEYYSSIDDSLTGDALLNKLHELNAAKKTKKYVYQDLRFLFKYTDLDPKGEVPSGKIVGFYDNSTFSSEWDQGKTWNREHVWPDSRGGNKVEGDLHMVRPTLVASNSGRGNKAYGIGSGLYDPNEFNVPEYRGISARIIFYCAIADTSLKIVDNGSESSNTMGVLSTMLKWNRDYMPEGQDSSKLAYRVEAYRNEVIYKHKYMELGGNRNPFIDHPEYACRIWGNTNSATKAACGM